MARADAATARWSEAKAHDWYGGQPWLVGCNFIPSTAVNQLEMWQEPSFDAETIDRELGWAEGLGFNTVRVFLHDLLWEADGKSFARRIDRFLQIASGHGIGTMFGLFDDCWHSGPQLGPQPPPVPGAHNSRWVQSPGCDAIDDPASWPRLEAYVNGLVRAFGADQRVLAWDLYNEVTNLFLTPPAQNDAERAQASRAAARRRAERKERHLRLFDLASSWARVARPEQPLTAGVWFRDREVNIRIIERSGDISQLRGRGRSDDAHRAAAALQPAADLHRVHVARAGQPV